MTSNFNVEAWSQYLEHHHDRIIINFLRYSWPVDYTSSVLASSTFHSHFSATKNCDYLSSYISKELLYKAVFGPFHCNPFNTPCMISPLLCIPKLDSLNLRVLHDLSFPEGASINDRISNDRYLGEFYKLCLPGIDHLVHFVNVNGHGCHIFTTDPH